MLSAPAGMAARTALSHHVHPLRQPRLANSGTNNSELKHWVAVHRVSGIGPARFGQLETHFGSIEAAWRAPLSALLASGIGAENARSLDALRNETDPDAEMARIAKLGIRAVHLRSPDYPELLREIYDPPPVLYYRGVLPASEPHSLAVVGSRRCTSYGREVTRRITTALAESGVAIFSGLARGIDGIAHQAALDAGGRTVAVVGGGLESIYPAEHTKLAADIVASGGAVVTEYPAGTRARPEHFPRRNRVISGLTRGVLVVEGRRTSGAMLTVKWALEQDREVFAIPGSLLSENSEGPNWLIQQGAKLVLDHRDILDELNITPAVPATGHGEQTPTQGELGVDILAREDNEIDIEDRVLTRLAAAGEPVHVDDITRAVGSPAPEVSSVLTVLELKGAVTQVGRMLFVANKADRRSDR